ncbi:MAG: mechanosensitive ion channel family protein [Candidatus Eisenbacteria bacterium]
MVLDHAAFLLATRATRTGWRALIPEPEKLAEMGGRVLLTLVAALVAQRLLFLLVGRIENVVRRAGHESVASQQRASTVGQVLRNFITTLVGVSAFAHVLAILGWDVKPILAGAGILGVALGFGAQTLVRDLIAGFFILAEDQFSVGDLIEINGKGATVEAITLRATTLRDFNGFVHFVPNGEMKIVTNRSRGWQRLAVDVPVATGSDLDTALAVCRREAENMNADPHWRERLMDSIDVWGIESLGPTESVIRLVLRAKPGPDAPEVSRELRRRLHAALTAAGHRYRSAREVVISPDDAGSRT